MTHSIEDTRAALEELLPPQAVWWADQFDRFMEAILDRAARREEPVPQPDATILRPRLWACQGGHDGTLDHNSAWRRYWGTEAGALQGLIRGLFRLLRDHQFPQDRYEPIVAALAEHVVQLHKNAAERQKTLLAKRHGPAIRGKAATNLLALLPDFTTAFIAWTETARDAAGVPFVALGQALPRLRTTLERELSS